MPETIVSPNNIKIAYRGRAQKPWTGLEFAAKHNHALSGPAASKAAAMASAILRRGGNDRVAIATANKKVGDLRKRGLISDRAHARMKSSGLDRDPDLDAATA